MIANAQNPSILCDGGRRRCRALRCAGSARLFPPSVRSRLDHGRARSGRARHGRALGQGHLRKPLFRDEGRILEHRFLNRVGAVDGRDYDELIAIGDRNAGDSAKARKIPVCFGGRIREQPAHREVGRDAWSLEAIPKRAGTDMKCTGCVRVITTSELSGDA